MIAKKGADQYMLRLPAGLRERVAKRAEKNGRSMNTEIVEAVEYHLRRKDNQTLIACAVFEMAGFLVDLADKVGMAAVRKDAADLEARLSRANLGPPGEDP